LHRCSHCMQCIAFHCISLQSLHFIAVIAFQGGCGATMQPIPLRFSGSDKKGT
jgi:hypothetical protein